MCPCEVMSVCLPPQANGHADRIETVKPMFVEPRGKGTFNEVSVLCVSLGLLKGTLKKQQLLLSWSHRLLCRSVGSRLISSLLLFSGDGRVLQQSQRSIVQRGKLLRCVPRKGEPMSLSC